MKKLSMKMWIAFVGAIAALSLSGAAAASVTWSFAGKGDVQAAFKWNNAQLQANAPGITFTYVETFFQRQLCDGPDVFYSRYRYSTLALPIPYQVRTAGAKGQITGFALGHVDYAGSPVATYGEWLGDVFPPQCFDPALVPDWAIYNDPTDLIKTALAVNYGGRSVTLLEGGGA
jgi:hypothetical protein